MVVILTILVFPLKMLHDVNYISCYSSLVFKRGQLFKPHRHLHTLS
jgi:hypothetical protein